MVGCCCCCGGVFGGGSRCRMPSCFFGFLDHCALSSDENAKSAHAIVTGRKLQEKHKEFLIFASCATALIGPAGGRISEVAVRRRGLSAAATVRRTSGMMAARCVVLVTNPRPNHCQRKFRGSGMRASPASQGQQRQLLSPVAGCSSGRPAGDGLGGSAPLILQQRRFCCRAVAVCSNSVSRSSSLVTDADSSSSRAATRRFSCSARRRGRSAERGM